MRAHLRCELSLCAESRPVIGSLPPVLRWFNTVVINMNSVDPTPVGRYPDMDTNFYTTQQVSELTGLGIDWIWRLARENKIPHHKAGGRYYRWTAEDIATWTEQTAVKPVKSGAQDLITMGRRRS